MTIENCTTLNPCFPILLIDNEAQILDLMQITLKVAGYNNVKAFTQCNEALKFIKENTCDAVLLDIMMQEMSGIEMLKSIKEIDIDLPVIMVTGMTECEIVVKCMRSGAYDYIVKPIESERILTSVSNALRIRELNNEYMRLAESMLANTVKHPEIFESIVTQNSRMLTIFKYIEAIAPSKQPVLITGETGTGKEMIARALHDASGAKGKFVAVNVAGLDDSIFSDSLFGHVKGSFTGADSSRAGLIESASEGTLFLDEIGDLTVQSQVKLLRLIQQYEYFPIGSDAVHLSNARILTATSKDIVSLEKSGSMRKDLFYRLRTHHIALPALRERKDDLKILVNFFVNKISEEQKKQKPFVPPELITLLNTWYFPGNIRELEGMIYDALSVHQAHILSLRTFKERMGLSDTQGESIAGTTKQILTFDDRLPTLQEIEEMVVNEAIERAGGNQSIAADLLGITRQSLNYRLKKNIVKDQ